MVSSQKNRKRLTGLLILVVVAALLAVYLLYFRSRHDPPNEPPEAPASSALRPDYADWDALSERAGVVAQVHMIQVTRVHGARGSGLPR